MSDWRERAEMVHDVVFFNYVASRFEASSDEVYVWDLDKTYLDTHLGSLSDVIRTLLEKAFQKRNVPGTATLVKALASSWHERGESKPFPIYFITASPPQMEEMIHDKLELDEISPFGCFFKDNFRNLSPRLFRQLTQQVGYKLQALLELRGRLREDVIQVFWGDDSESDATIYSLYSDICARRFSEKELRLVLRNLHVNSDQIDIIFDLQRTLPQQDPVEKVYINLASDTDPEYYLKFGRRTIPTYNSFQVALDLFQDGRITKDSLLKVVNDMGMNFGYTSDELEWGLDDLIRRQVLGEPAVEALIEILRAHDAISSDFSPSLPPLKVARQVGPRVFELEGQTEPWVPDHIDYLHDYR